MINSADQIAIQLENNFNMYPQFRSSSNDERCGSILEKRYGLTQLPIDSFTDLSLPQDDPVSKTFFQTEKPTNFSSFSNNTSNTRISPIQLLDENDKQVLVNPIELIDESYNMPNCVPARQQAIEILPPTKLNKAIEVFDAPSDAYSATHELPDRNNSIRELTTPILVGDACDESFKHDAENFFNTLPEKVQFYSKFSGKKVSLQGLVPNPHTAEPCPLENENLGNSQSSLVTVVTEEDGMYTQEIKDKKLHKSLICNFILLPFKNFVFIKATNSTKVG